MNQIQESSETASQNMEPATETEASLDSSDSGQPTPASNAPISLDRIRQLRMSQQAAAPQTKSRSSHKHGADSAQPESSKNPQPTSGVVGDRGDLAKKYETGKIVTPPPGPAPKIAVPSRRTPLSQDMETELEAALGSGDLDSLLIGDELLQVGRELEEGQRMQAVVMKSNAEYVFFSLGGANEGVVQTLQFEHAPEVGAAMDVVVRGYLREEGLYELTVPGNAISVSDWEDLNEGEVVEATITASNTGGLECNVGNIRGFIPASQASEFRVEDLSEFVGQKVLCVVTEANPRRGNLVLSRRAVLEREKQEKREQRLAALEPGSAVEGTVRKIMDFGAFVDIGGLDGLLHVSQLSWEKVKHPSDVLSEGQKIQVRVDKIDPQSGKISLSYRSLQEHPWANIEQRFPAGGIVTGTVSRIAEFGAFVKLATGVEGLVHVSELAHHRVTRVSNVVQEGQEVSVKILSVEPDKQRMSLSIKRAQAAPAEAETSKEEVEEPLREMAVPKHRGPLKGGVGKDSGGEQFGLKW